MDEQLFAGGGIAAYTWGSLLLESSSLAPVDGASITRTLAAVSAGTLPADSPRDQRSAVSLLHELIHLQQDLATGLGAWDHVTTREPYLRLATQSRWLVWPNHEPPYREVVEQSLRELGENAFTEQVRQDLVAISDSTIALRQLRGGDWATGPIRTYVEQRVGSVPREEDYADLSLRRMLESEAACITYRVVQGTRHSEDAQEWLRDHKELWLLPFMGPEYLEVVQMVGKVLDSTEVTADRLWNWLDTMALIVPWVVDLACAYPTPTQLAASPLAPEAFDPVVRFGEIMRGLQRLDESMVRPIAEGIINNRWAEAEAAFAATVDVRYPSTTQTYEGWLDHMSPLAASDEWDATLFGLRVDALDSRLSGNPPKGLQAMLDAQTPLQVLVQGTGMQGIQHGKHIYSWEALKHAFVDRRLDMELYDLIHDSGRFSCPYGRAARSCPGEQPWRLSGIARLPQFPDEAKCYVRRSLKEAGWALPKPEVGHG